VTMHYWFIR